VGDTEGVLSVTELSLTNTDIAIYKSIKNQGAILKTQLNHQACAETWWLPIDLQARHGDISEIMVPIF
jgi:hypothetical protein